MSNNYRLSKSQKAEIAKNLIDILQIDANISHGTKTFICNWILTGPEGKKKAFFDVWDIVLRNYLPTTRPTLFRTCRRISKNNKISSFTGRLECARKISESNGFLIICETKETLQFEEEFFTVGNYKNTFYPLVDVLIKARNSGKGEFSERFLNDYIGEDEYIMRINLGNSCSFKWIKNNY